MTAPTLAFYSSTVTGVDGYAIPGATIIVLSGTIGGSLAVNASTKPGTPLAAIYSDPYGQDAIDQAGSPLVSDGQGNFGFWAASGLSGPAYYVLQIYGNGVYQVIDGVTYNQYLQGISIGNGTEQVVTVPWVNVKTAPYNALGNGKYALNLNVTVSTTALTLSDSPDFGPWMSDTFSPSDAGKPIIIYGGGAGGTTYSGTIVSVSDSTHATISPAAGATVTYGEGTWAGTATDGAAIQAAINATTSDTSVVYIPNGVYWTTQNITTGAAPYCAKVFGDNPARTIIVCSNPSLNAEGWTFPDAPFGFEFSGITTFGPGTSQAGLTSANGVHFSTVVQIPKERLWFHDVRISQYPQAGLIVECPIVSLFENFTADNCGVTAIHVTTALGFAGTSTTFNNGYANAGGTNGWLIDGAFYCNFNGCASDSSVTNWHIINGSANSFNSCGSEGASGDSWLLDSCPNMNFNSIYIEIDPPVVSTQVLIHAINNSSSLTFINPIAEVNGTVTNALLFDDTVAYCVVINAALQNYNTFTPAGPLTDLGYANIIIAENAAQSGIALYTNDRTTIYNLEALGEVDFRTDIHVGTIIPDQIAAITTGEVALVGWGGNASLNYVEGSQTAFGIGINCLGTNSTLSAVGNAVTVDAQMSAIVSNGLTTTYHTALSPVPIAGGQLSVYGATNATNNGAFNILYADGAHVVVDNPNGVNETPPTYPTAAAEIETASYTGTFSAPYSYGDKVLIGGFVGVGNIGEFNVFSCNSTTLVVDNGGATLESHAGTAWLDDQTANPTVTLTFPVAFAEPPTVVVSDYTSDDFNGSFKVTDSATDHVTFTFVGTPINGDSYGLFSVIFSSF